MNGNEYLNAISVYIFNPLGKESYLEVASVNVTMIQEAKNENVQWIPIEYFHNRWCDGQTQRILKIESQDYSKLK